MNDFCPPVLFCIFNRPHLVERSFQAIREARPSLLFVAADGPRALHDIDRALCEQSRRVIEGIDWPCNVKTLFREENLGCGDAISSAISWFFDNVEYGIILEDDCLPHPTFFQYCKKLLERYRDDTRVWCISGNNFQGGRWRGDGSYYFSQQTLIWGWATWRRCWTHYDKELAGWEALKNSGHLESIYPDQIERDYQSSKWDLITGPRPLDTWDYQWHFTCVSHGGLTAIPNRNLVTNIGFDGGGVHCFGKTPDPGLGDGLSTLLHPRFVLRHSQADRYMFDTLFGGSSIRKNQVLGTRLRCYLRNLRLRLIALLSRMVKRQVE